MNQHILQIFWIWYLLTDLKGPMNASSYSGAKYFIPLLHDACGLSLVQLISAKSQSSRKLDKKDVNQN